MSIPIAYYKDGVPYSADGGVIIVITGKLPEGTGGGGSVSADLGKGGVSESSAAIHATAKWSTAQLKKTKAEQAAREREAVAAQAKAKEKRDALTQYLKDIVNNALKKNYTHPAVIALAHQNNMDMQSEAWRLNAAKAERKARKEAQKAEEEMKAAQRKKEEVARQLAETERQFKLAEEEEKLLATLSEEARAVEYARKELAAVKSELVKADADIQSKRAIVSRLSGEVREAQKRVDIKQKGFPGWKDVQKKLERQLQGKKKRIRSGREGS